MNGYNKELGRAGEEKAAGYLKRRGYKILDRNFTIRGGELDIVAMDKATLVFAEVKTRTNEAYGKPIDAINQSKINYIKNCANYYIYSKKLYDIPVRFDVIEVYINPGKAMFNTKIVHTKEAFF